MFYGTIRTKVLSHDWNGDEKSRDEFFLSGRPIVPLRKVVAKKRPATNSRGAHNIIEKRNNVISQCKILSVCDEFHDAVTFEAHTDHSNFLLSILLL